LIENDQTDQGIRMAVAVKHVKIRLQAIRLEDDQITATNPNSSHVVVRVANHVGLSLRTRRGVPHDRLAAAMIARHGQNDTRIASAVSDEQSRTNRTTARFVHLVTRTIGCVELAIGRHAEPM
jgi:hypothetical protein